MTRLEQLSEANRQGAASLDWLREQLTGGHLPELEKARAQLAAESENSPTFGHLARPVLAALDEMLKYRQELARNLASIANALRA